MKPSLLALVLLGSLQAADLRVVSDMEGHHIRHRSIIGIPTEQQLERIASELLGSGETTLGSIVAYGSPEDRVLSGPRGFDHCGYGHWRSMIEAHESQRGCPEVREAAKIGSNVVIRSLDHACGRSSKLLIGNVSPLDLVVDGASFEVLDMSFSRPMGQENEHRIHADLYVRAKGTVSTGRAKALTARIRDLTGVEEISVELRSDPWFITDCGFPALFPFESQPPIPTLEEFSRTKYASCGSFAFTRGNIQCFEGLSRP
jgi:hypothetical protein